jgi:hypothetical protein
MKRRELITLLGSAAAWPLAARAQQERMRRIGVFMNTAADDPTGQARLLAFAQTLAQSDWTDGRNVRMDIRWGAGDAERIRRYAAELVALAPDVILASDTTTLGPLRQVSRTVPTVFTGVGDAVGAGFVDSLARPGGNVTGFIAFEWSISGKWLELLKEIAPGVTRAVVSRRILSGDQGMLVWWSIGAGVHVEPHSHANEQIVWMLKGKMEFRLGSEQRVCGPGDVVVHSRKVRSTRDGSAKTAR